MDKTCDFLDEIGTMYALPSDYAIAKKLGLSKQAISAYRNGRDTLGEDAAPRVAELLDLPAPYVLACARLERARTDRARATWREILAKFPRPLTERKRPDDGPEQCILCEIPTSYRRRKSTPVRAIVPAAILALSQALRPVRALSA